MTISKKLSLAIALALGMQFVASINAYDYYDNPHICAAKEYCLNVFKQTLYQHNSREAYNVAQWLDKKITKTFCKMHIREMFALADIATNSELTIESKIAIFSEKIRNEEEQKIAEQKFYEKEERRQKFNKICDAIAATTLFAGFIGLTALAIIEDIKNPRPIVYVQQRKPTVSITWTEKYPSWPYSYTYTWPWYY